MLPSTWRERAEVARAAIARAASRSWTAHGGDFGEIEVASIGVAATRLDARNMSGQQLIRTSGGVRLARP